MENRRHLLLVEDEPSLVLALTDRLEAEDYRVTAVGGRVSVRSDRESGTTVTLHLPLPCAMEAADGEPTTPAAGRG